jgi:hypothetical protein
VKTAHIKTGFRNYVIALNSLKNQTGNTGSTGSPCAFLDTILMIFGFLPAIIKIMSDLLFLAIIAVFLLATAGLILLCQRLMKQ